MKKQHLILLAGLVTMMISCNKNTPASSESIPELDSLVAQLQSAKPHILGYPVNQRSELHDFYEWYHSTGLDTLNLNNAGNPFDEEGYAMSTRQFERDVLEYFAPYYGFDVNNLWGLVTNSGTDGNNHGIYFGANVLYRQTGRNPIVYVSNEAHYSNMRICDLQNLELRLIKTDSMGRMLPEDLEQQLDPTRGCLIVYAMGSTFKGAVDDIETLNSVLDKYPQMPVYRHLDAALFGGYLPFTQYKEMVNCQQLNVQSISISGHKFFGIDSPCGLFLTSKDVYDGQDSFDIPYLNSNMRMISCSRDAIQPLKFWWLIRRVGADKWSEQAAQMLKSTQYLKQELTKIGWPCWCNEYSNTVFFRRPSQALVQKYCLACGYDELFGGNLSHIVVMQHVSPEAIDRFIADLQKEINQ